MAAVLRWALPGFLAFIAAAMLARPNWLALAKGSVVPALSLSRGALAGALALLGTTLTSYVYVWETVQRGMEEPAGDLPTGRRLRRVRTGAVAGAVFTAAILWSMLAASAATLGRRHRAVDSARDAAAALRPFAGPLAADLFAAGLVVSAVVALPVLVACTGYVVGAQFDWRRGLSVPVGRAPRFYAALIAPVALAVTVTLAGVPVFGMLVAASLIGGLATPIGLVILLRLARDHEVMRGRPISARLATAGWAVCLIVAGLGILLILKMALGSR